MASTLAASPEHLGGPDWPAFPLNREDTLLAQVRNGSTSRLPTIPGVQSLAMAMRYLPGGRNSFIEYVQMAALNGSEDAKRWLTVYTSLAPSMQPRVSFDDVCAGSGVYPKNLMAVVVSTAMEFGQDVSNLVAAAVQGSVVDAMGKSALRTTGKYADIAQKDRVAFLSSSVARFLPTRGTTVNVSASASAQAASASAAEPSVPSFADDMASLAPPPRVIDVIPEPTEE